MRPPNHEAAQWQGQGHDRARLSRPTPAGRGGHGRPGPALGPLPVFDDAEVEVREFPGVKGSQQPDDSPKVVLSVGIGDLGTKPDPGMSAWGREAAEQTRLPKGGLEANA